MPAEKIYENLSISQWHQIKQAASNYGILIMSTAGSSEAMGASFSWEWSQTRRRLKITILNGGIWGEEAALSFVNEMILGSMNGMILGSLITPPAK